MRTPERERALDELEDDAPRRRRDDCMKCGDSRACQQFGAHCELDAMTGYKPPCAIRKRRREAALSAAGEQPTERPTGYRRPYSRRPRRAA